jgi:signal transduction histidine kinase
MRRTAVLRDVRPLLAATGTLTLGAGLVYALLLVPGLRPWDGYYAAVDLWLNFAVDAAVIVVVLLRSLVDRRDRLPWLLLGGGLLMAFAASCLYYGYHQSQDPIPAHSWSDVGGWLGFYALLYVGLVLLLRARVRRMLRSVWLDGLVAGLTAAALALVFLEGARVPPGDEVTGLTTAYPLADLLLLALGVAALTVLGRGSGPAWWLLCTSFVVFAITDSLYAQQVALGSYDTGDPIDAGWLLARLCLVGAALTSARARARGPVDLEGASVLALPGVCGLLVLLVLFTASHRHVPALATVLALVAGVLMVARTALTFRELSDLTQAKRRALMERLVVAQDEERARIAADVHDDSLQALAAVDLRLGALRNRLTTRAPDEVERVETVVEAVHEAAVRLRHLLFELETPALEADLGDALRDAAAYVFEDSGVGWTVEERRRGPLPQQTRVSAYRIAREAMVNARKHARADAVTMTVDVTPAGVEVQVLDDGVGVAATTQTPSGRRHSGLVAMRDRALASGGRWRSEPGPGGRGTRVVLWLPAAEPDRPLPAQQAAHGLGGAGDADDEVALQAPPQDGGEVGAEGSLQQVRRAAGRDHLRPRRRVRLR